MSRDQFESFEEFWPYYLAEHSDPTNRALHFLGLAAAAGTLGYAVASRKPKLLGLVPVLGYGAAWVGHYLVEKNRPATFSHPLWSLRGDFKMVSMMATGQLDDELQRYGIGRDELPVLE